MGLVLKRKVGEKVIVRLSEIEAIGGVLEITVLEAGGSRASLRFDAPREAQISRAEVDRDAA